MIDIGDRIPDRTVATDGGATVALFDLVGGRAVIYFYPKDDTPGCTTEAQGFRDAIADFAAASVTVIGVSKDGVAKHDRFKAKHNLPFTLISDADGTLCEDFGTWVEKSMYGRKYFGIDRATFLVDAGGVVRRVWRKVKVKGHVAEVLEAAREFRTERLNGPRCASPIILLRSCNSVINGSRRLPSSGLAETVSPILAWEGTWPQKSTT